MVSIKTHGINSVQYDARLAAFCAVVSASEELQMVAQRGMQESEQAVIVATCATEKLFGRNIEFLHVLARGRIHCAIVVSYVAYYKGGFTISFPNSADFSSAN